MATKTKPAAAPLRTVTVRGKKFVMVPAADFRRMTQPGLGTIDALAFADAAIAQSIVRDRNAVGLSQKELADRAGIRVEVLNRAERGAVVPSVRTLTKIENALQAAGLKRPSPR